MTPHDFGITQSRSMTRHERYIARLFFALGLIIGGLLGSLITLDIVVWMTTP